MNVIKQIANRLRTFGECSINTHEIGCETPRNSPRPPRNRVRTLRQAQGPIHRARILTLPIAHICITKSGIRITESIFFSFSNSYIHFTACTFHITIYIYISDSPNPYICIIAHVFSHYQIRISPPHYVCVYLYAGAINRPLRLLTVCQLRGEHSTKHSTYTHEMGCEHPARRRGRFIVPVS